MTPHSQERKTVELNIEWIERLRAYTDKVRMTAEEPMSHKFAVTALMGYLDSLDIYLPNPKKHE